MAILLDPPAWPAHGRLWSHLVSDASYDELHAFAAAHGVPRRGFERDHYDVPAEAYAGLLNAGAQPVSSRELLQRLSLAGLRRRKASAMARRAPGNALLRPARLSAGDLVAVVAVAGPVEPERLDAGIERLRSWGLRVRVEPHTLDRHPLGYLAGSDADRAEDFTSAWMDDDVAAVVAGRGGYGTERMLGLLDWRRLAEARPKILAGFSDVTALHLAVAGRLGLVTLHTHVATSLGVAESGSADRLRAMLMDPAAVDLFAGLGELRPVVTGSAVGVLIGGNLSMLASSVGTSSYRPATGGLVVVEEVTEEPYRIDRLLTQLLRAGWFTGVRGIILGSFTDCGDPASVDAVLRDRLGPLGVPLVSGFDFGHTPTTRSVPLGVRATLDVPAAGMPVLRLTQSPFT